MSGYWEATDDPLNRRTCPTCGKTSDGSDCFGGPDPCLGRIPGVAAACCGHGVLRETDAGTVDTCYVSFGGIMPALYGDDARGFFANISRRVPERPA